MRTSLVSLAIGVFVLSSTMLFCSGARQSQAIVDPMRSPPGPENEFVRSEECETLGDEIKEQVTDFATKDCQCCSLEFVTTIVDDMFHLCQASEVGANYELLLSLRNSLKTPSRDFISRLPALVQKIKAEMERNIYLEDAPIVSQDGESVECISDLFKLRKDYIFLNDQSKGEGIYTFADYILKKDCPSFVAIETNLVLANLDARWSKYKKAEDESRKALKKSQVVGYELGEMQALAVLLKMEAHGDGGEYIKNPSLSAKKVVSSCESIFGKASYECLSLATLVGDIYISNRDYMGALEVFQLQRERAARVGNHFLELTGMRNEMRALRTMNNVDDALAIAREGYLLSKKMYGECHPLSIDFLQTISMVEMSNLELIGSIGDNSWNYWKDGREQEFRRFAYIAQRMENGEEWCGAYENYSRAIKVAQKKEFAESEYKEELLGQARCKEKCLHRLKY